MFVHQQVRQVPRIHNTCCIRTTWWIPQACFKYGLSIMCQVHEGYQSSDRSSHGRRCIVAGCGVSKRDFTLQRHVLHSDLMKTPNRSYICPNRNSLNICCMYMTRTRTFHNISSMCTWELPNPPIIHAVSFSFHCTGSLQRLAFNELVKTEVPMAVTKSLGGGSRKFETDRAPSRRVEENDRIFVAMSVSGK